MLLNRYFFVLVLYTCKDLILIHARKNISDFQAIYLDARCLATCSTEFSSFKPLEHMINSSTSWPIFDSEFNGNILLCYYSCIQCDQERSSQGNVYCATSAFEPCIAGRLYCREDTFSRCNGSKPSTPLQKPILKFSYTDFNSIEVSWPITSDLPIYPSTEQCLSYTTFILRLKTLDAIIYYMAFKNSTKIQLFNNLVNSFSNSFNISVGAVNKVGFSEFGPENVFQLRDRDPGPVRNLRYRYSENSNYPDEYRLLLKWDLPNLNYENLYSIFLNVKSVGNSPFTLCSKFSILKINKTIQLSRDTTQYLFQHKEDFLGPISNCQYEFILTSKFSIFDISLAKLLISFPYICKKSSLPFEIDFSFLPFNREYSFLRIQGSWQTVLNETLLYILQLSIKLDNSSGSQINIAKTTFSPSIEISFKGVAVQNVFRPPIYLHYLIYANLSAHLNCNVASHKGFVVLNALFPTVPLNLNATYNVSTNYLRVHWDEPSNFGGPLTGYQLIVNYTTFEFIIQNISFDIKYGRTKLIVLLENATLVSIKMRAANIFGYGLFTQFKHLYFEDQIDSNFLFTATNIPTAILTVGDSFSKITVLIITPFATLLIGTLLIMFFSCIFLITRRNRGRLRLSQSGSRYSIDKFEIPYSQLLFLPQTLGTGAFGLVKKAILKKSSKYSIVVAVKMTRDDATDIEVNDLVQEIYRMKRIGRHPHIVEFLGCVSSVRPICLILEFVPFGDLLTLLRKLRNERDRNTGPNYIRWFGLLTLSDLSGFALQIAQGMEYISSLKLVHRDLACRNILVAENKQLKISDFGLAREFDKHYDCNDDKDYYRLHIHNDRLPIRWMAIESITEFIFSIKSDVWSYGIALWEIATLGRTPYSSIPNSRFLQFIFSKNRLEVPANCTPEMFELMRSCWNENPDHRPNFEELQERLKKLLIKYEEKKILSIELSDNDELTSADLSGSFNWELPDEENQHARISNSIMEQNLEGNSSLDLMKHSSENRDKTKYTENQTCNSENSPTISPIKTFETYEMHNETVIVNENEENENVISDISSELRATGRLQSNKEVLPYLFPKKTTNISLNTLLSQYSSDHFSKCAKNPREFLIDTNILSSNSIDKFVSNSFNLFEMEVDRSSRNNNSHKSACAPNPNFVNISDDPETEL